MITSTEGLIKFVKHWIYIHIYLYSLKSYPGLTNIIKQNKLSFICSEEKKRLLLEVRRRKSNQNTDRHISHLIPKRTWKCYYICCFGGFFPPSFPSRWTTFIKAQLLTWYTVGEKLAHISSFFHELAWCDNTWTLDAACTRYCLAEDQLLSIFSPHFLVVLEINAYVTSLCRKVPNVSCH